MNKKIIGGIIIVAVVIFAVVMVKNKNTESVGTNQVVPTQTTTTNQGQTTGITAQVSNTAFTLDQVAIHNTEADCYAAINGNVYNLTAWIKKHPGGDRAILSICGKDGSAAFNGQHGTDKKPERILAGFEVGVITQ